MCKKSSANFCEKYRKYLVRRRAPENMLGCSPQIPIFAQSQLFYFFLKVLSRKAEGLDPAKP